MSCFQAIFLPGPHSTGSGPVAWPCPVGPRNCGQLSPWASAGSIATARAAARERIDGLRGFADPAMVHIMEPERGEAAPAILRSGDFPISSAQSPRHHSQEFFMKTALAVVTVML